MMNEPSLASTFSRPGIAGFGARALVPGYGHSWSQWRLHEKYAPDASVPYSAGLTWPWRGQQVGTSREAQGEQ